MESAMQSLGFEVSLRRKPTSYRQFQKMIASNDSAIVLVSSSNSTCYWKNTPGHYVTVFLYDKRKMQYFWEIPVILSIIASGLHSKRFIAR
jgi:hypothetical protein